ncbi:DyP-type peroxidase [Pleurotus ostreatus PC15]|uniref:DyP-type peroxidase n=2 Tax=Pleurotus TaxID=5320 RepID=A0A067NEG2_PLEO1|nr:DyP-type peroxidase [Pleurotus ostreatus PC15]
MLWGTLSVDYPGQGGLPSLEVIQSLNVTNGTFMPLHQIQGDILIGMKKPKELFFFYTIKDTRRFKQVLAKDIYPHITTTAQLICGTCPQTSALLNVAWTSKGLKKLNVHGDTLDKFFNMGQAADASALGDNDPPTNWVPALLKDRTHGAFLIASNDWAPVDALLARIIGFLGTSIVEVHRLKGAHRPGAFAGHEHFGYLDGISQPAIGGFATSILPGQSLVLPGTILTGELGDPLALTRPSWMKWGSFMAFRQLQQFVPEFDEHLLQMASAIPDETRTKQERAELLGARMFGRWKSGTPLDLAPDHDVPAIGSNSRRNNDFDYNHPPPFNIFANQSRCPFSSHIRKARPRADQANLNIFNQIMRAGLPYGDEVTDAEREKKTTTLERGFAFVSYQSDIGLGFRFQQVVWANNIHFPFLKDKTPGYDPIIGQNGANPVFSSGIDYKHPDQNSTYMSFILSRGGEYLYSPSMSAILDPIAA